MKESTYRRSVELVGFLACIALALLVGLAAYAAVINISWTNATTNTDGSAIPSTGDGRIIATNIEYGPCNAARDGLASVTNTIVVSGTAATAQTPDLPPGTWCARAAHVNSYNKASAWSDVAVRVIEAPTPNRPTNFTFG